MPGWHERTKNLHSAATVQTFGIVLEQHPDRARLFMQWKEMNWWVIVDPLNLMDLRGVPVTVLIDEAGTVRTIDPSEEEFKVFLAAPRAQQTAVVPDTDPPVLARLKRRSESGEAADLRAYADALVLWGRAVTDLDLAIDTYRAALDLEPTHGQTHFRLGVAYRKRVDSSRRRTGDFARAIEHWSRALEIDPNQYIWRRRIQQYGPRLDKPYPFYDWIATARKEIEARGEDPYPLIVEPSGAELASPSESIGAKKEAPTEPDPDGRIDRDPGRLIRIDAVTVPATDPANDAMCLHLILSPNEENKGHWNNQADEMVVWIDPPEGWEIDRRRTSFPHGKASVTKETRRIDFELRPTGPTGPRESTLTGYALYYVCEGPAGVCLFRRQDIKIPVLVGNR